MTDFEKYFEKELENAMAECFEGKKEYINKRATLKRLAEKMEGYLSEQEAAGYPRSSDGSVAANIAFLWAMNVVEHMPSVLFKDGEDV